MISTWPLPEGPPSKMHNTSRAHWKRQKRQKRQKERKGNGKWNKREFIFEKQKKFVQTVFYLTWCDDETTILEDDLKCPPWRWPYKESI